MAFARVSIPGHTTAFWPLSQTEPASIDPPRGLRSATPSLEDVLPLTLSQEEALDARTDCSRLLPRLAYGWHPTGKSRLLQVRDLLPRICDAEFSSGIGWESGSTSVLKQLVNSATKSGKGT
ncbi:uncharacterized protein PHACADRAFT_206245 [Phanerochaete carnosa HHB-10118-sp]|uniref:Uncharacterized protein n=1 Tax=Phanerochaete carnosa (strain HHB-10118-sp) TaxID=650164 RepID=K5VAY3_PHACS|nr:uncharacterized protein PHACADRAFT_206245 [Phanerochaete carnosa HHB-10118-sp]EKM60036.1 hypothetical protein PHACADRAFT_206245 [Phanerochaete carnosa HHB-10118-sp]